MRKAAAAFFPLLRQALSLGVRGGRALLSTRDAHVRLCAGGLGHSACLRRRVLLRLRRTSRTLRCGPLRLGQVRQARQLGVCGLSRRACVRCRRARRRAFHAQRRRFCLSVPGAPLGVVGARAAYHCLHLTPLRRLQLGASLGQRLVELRRSDSFLLGGAPLPARLLLHAVHTRACRHLRLLPQLYLLARGGQRALRGRGAHHRLVKRRTRRPVLALRLLRRRCFHGLHHREPRLRRRPGLLGVCRLLVGGSDGDLDTGASRLRRVSSQARFDLRRL
mmetsp:Transcript_16806/g.41401  ORF Transcript_16806/g.41401 Transcript_16806/m.41401 type:complete len:277 (+) Transcript_16806:179-1009(+)